LLLEHNGLFIQTLIQLLESKERQSQNKFVKKIEKRQAKTKKSLKHLIFSRTCVPEVGLEPTPPKGDWILSPARLPIPPLRLYKNNIKQVYQFHHRSPVEAELKSRFVWTL
jgi:hypothetical protein